MSIKEVKTFTYSNAIINVFIPDLTEEERSKRIEQIKKAASNLLMKGETK
jgi:ribosome recycling factor